MKLIEAEKTVEYIRNYGKSAIDDGRETLDPVDDIVNLVRIIEAMPDEETVKHEQWQKITEERAYGFVNMIICSGCGNKHVYFGHNGYKFCDECGARMDKQ